MRKRRLALDKIVAIDFHTHVEMSEAGVDSLPDELRDAAVHHFRGESTRPTAVELAEHYRARRMMAVIFTVDSESFTGQPRVPNEEIAEAARANADVLIPFASIDPHKGRRGVEEARQADHRPRRAGLQVPSERSRFLPERPHGLSLVRGDRRSRPAGALPHGAVGRWIGPAGRWRRPPQILEPDARRRRGRRLPRAEDRARAPVVPVAGRGARRRRAQTTGLHRSVGLVAEVLSASARPTCQHPAARTDALRHRLSVHQPRALARRLRDAGHQARGATVDPEAERDPPPRPGAK